MSSAEAAADTSETIGYLLIDQFSMVAFFSATEPLRIANRIAGRALYRWRLISESGAPVTASNGMRLLVDDGIAAIERLPRLAVCSGFLPADGTSRALIHWLARLDAAGCVLGGIDTGCFVLADAGLLAGARVTLHWESLPAFRERFPMIETSDALFELGDRRFSCAGGAAAMDMSLAMIGARHGEALAAAVAEQLIHDRLRPHDDRQRLDVARRLRIHHRGLTRAVALMERRLEQPLALAELAAAVGLSLRQLQRLFADQLGSTPGAWYLGLRLDRAQQLLRDTDRPVIEIAAACGFASSPSFARAYRQRFGRAPRAERSRNGSP